MQTACIEYARNVCGLADANSSEFDPATPHRVIYKLRELRAWKNWRHDAAGRMAVQDRGGNAGVPSLWPDRISERHRHRYEFNREYEETMVANGCGFPARLRTDVRGDVEIPGHPYFIGCQFHPEFKSKPLEPHPLFKAFVGASYAHGKKERA